MPKKINQGYLASFVLVLVIVVWMLFGILVPKPEFSNPRPLSLDSGLQRVQVEDMQGQLMQRDVSFSGYTAANRRVELLAEVRGKVIAIHKEKGSTVKQGDLILELDSRDWPARVEQAKANLKQRQLEADSARKLAAKGLSNEAQLAQAQTLLANAQAELTNAQLQLDATHIRAPFAGVVDQRFVEVGDFVRDGTALAVVLDYSPWLVKGQVAERDAASVHIGDIARAELVNGEVINGKIRFISSEADAKTRTFSVEMQATPNKSTLNSGLTARIFVPQPPTYAYFLSPALLVLNDQGKLGLKGIDEKNTVIFIPVDILKADNKGIWVYGNSTNARIITTGQGFVDYGQKVEPVYTAQSVE